MIVVPPLNFALVAHGIYRSGYPNKKNFEFLSRLNLKSVLYLCDDEYSLEYLDFFSENSLVFHIPLQSSKEPFLELDSGLMTEALSIVLDTRNHPILIHCNKGKHRIGCLVACIRKLENWSLSSILDEYKRFSGFKLRMDDQEFIQVFGLDYSLLGIPNEFTPKCMGKNRGVDDTSEVSRLPNTESIKTVSKKAKADDDKNTKIELTQKQQEKEKSSIDSGHDNSKRKVSAKNDLNVSDKIRPDTKDKETSAKKSDKQKEKEKSESSKKETSEASDTKKSREKLKSRDKKDQGQSPSIVGTPSQKRKESTKNGEIVDRKQSASARKESAKDKTIRDSVSKDDTLHSKKSSLDKPLSAKEKTKKKEDVILGKSDKKSVIEKVDKDAKTENSEKISKSNNPEKAAKLKSKDEEPKERAKSAKKDRQKETKSDAEEKLPEEKSRPLSSETDPKEESFTKVENEVLERVKPDLPIDDVPKEVPTKIHQAKIKVKPKKSVIKKSMLPLPRRKRKIKPNRLQKIMLTIGRLSAFLNENSESVFDGPPVQRHKPGSDSDDVASMEREDLEKSYKILKSIIADLERKLVREKERAKAMPKAMTNVPTSLEANMNLRYQYQKALDLERENYIKLERENQKLAAQMRVIEMKAFKFKKAQSIDEQSQHITEVNILKNKIKELDSEKSKENEDHNRTLAQLEKVIKERDKLANEIVQMRRLQIHISHQLAERYTANAEEENFISTGEEADFHTGRSASAKSGKSVKFAKETHKTPEHLTRSTLASESRKVSLKKKPNGITDDEYAAKAKLQEIKDKHASKNIMARGQAEDDPDFYENESFVGESIAESDEVQDEDISEADLRSRSSSQTGLSESSNINQSSNSIAAVGK